jgi:hypothetical protein
VKLVGRYNIGGWIYLLYKIVLFLHIFGVVLMFAAVGITLSTMAAMLVSKETKTIRIWSSWAVKMDGILPLSVVFVLLPGLYLVFTAWGWKFAWVNTSLILLLAMTFAGPIINLRRLKAILHLANTETNSSPSSELLGKVRDRTLWNSVSVMCMFLVGIIYLMTVKPGMSGSFLTLVITFILGLIMAKSLLGLADRSKEVNKSKSFSN